MAVIFHVVGLRSFIRKWIRSAEFRVLVGVLAIAFAVTVDAVTTVTRRKFDLQVYAGSINYWVDGGALYDYVRPGSKYGFTYPPFAAFLMSPMALLGWRKIVLVQALATAATAAGVLAWLLAPLSDRRGWPRWIVVALGLVALVALAPVRDVIGYGQVNILLLGLVAVDLGWWVARGYRCAGVGIGVATAIKLVPGLFVVYLLLTGRHRAAVTAVVTFLTVNTAAALVAPRDSLDYWSRHCWEIGRVGNPISTYNQSLRGGLLRMGLDSPWLWYAGCLMILGCWAWRVRKLPHVDERFGLALTGIVACLISPISWVHHLVWAIPALAVAVETGAWVLAGVAGVVFAIRITTLLDQTGWFARVIPGNAYLWVCLLLLFAVPSGARRFHLHMDIARKMPHDTSRGVNI